jgi:DNA-binding MarR family transcriptional regulator
MESHTTPWDLCISTRVRRASRRLTRIYDDVLTGADVTSTQWAILIALHENGAQTFTSCAELLTMDRTSLTHALHPLERDHLVELVPDERDRRVKRVQLTDAGRARVARGADGWRRAQARVVAVLGEHGAEDLRRTLDKLIDMPLTDEMSARG